MSDVVNETVQVVLDRGLDERLAAALPSAFAGRRTRLRFEYVAGEWLRMTQAARAECGESTNGGQAPVKD